MCGYYKHSEGKNKIISLTENDIKEMVTHCISLIREGSVFSPNGNGTINYTVNHSSIDADNAGFDTRIFGNKNDILYGDGTNQKQRFYLNDIHNIKNSLIKTYKSLIDYIKNGRNGTIYTDEFTPKGTISAINKNLSDSSLSDNEIIRLATRNISKQSDIASVYGDTFNRVNSLNNNTKTERYLMGTVPGTKVKLISLFTFKDFNNSDAIKNGNLRQNDNTDKMLGIDSSQRELVPKLYGKGKQQQEKIKVTYDNGIEPNLNNNFSLVNNYGKNGYDVNHFGRVRRDYMDSNYTSVSELQDKSIMYASYALKKDNIQPNFIVAAPSSSNFNNNYCIRLSDKTGIEYVPNFFKRNVINVILDKEGLTNVGVAIETANEIENTVLNVTYSELSDKISSHIKQFFRKNKNYFENVNAKKFDRNKTDIRVIESFVVNYSYDYLLRVLDNLNYVNDALSMTILNNLSFAKKSKRIEMDNLHMQNQISSIIFKNKILLKEFTMALNRMAFTMVHYRKQLLNGYKPNFDSKKFKITDFDDVARPFLKNCYVIADSELSMKNGKELFSRYKNAKFLVFDEDMQSGGTLKLLIQCMKDKLIPQENITCLVQAYGTQ